MVFSAAQTVCCGKDESEYRRRAEAISRDPDQLRARGVAGTVAEVVEAGERPRIYGQIGQLAPRDRRPAEQDQGHRAAAGRAPERAARAGEPRRRSAITYEAVVRLTGQRQHSANFRNQNYCL